MLASDTPADLQLELLLVSERLAHVLQVVDGPDQLFLLIHILVGFIAQLPFKLQNLFDLRADAAMEYLV